MKISSIAALLLIGTTIMMAENTPEIEEIFNESEPFIHHEEVFSHETDWVVPDGAEDAFNTYYGQGAGNAGGGRYNAFFGGGAGYTNTGDFNTFIGHLSGYHNTTGSSNTFSGVKSGYYNTTGYRNTFSGDQSGLYNTTGHSNTFSGIDSGRNNTVGYNNTFSGDQSGVLNTIGHDNTFSGQESGRSNTSGNYNTFSGRWSGYSNTTGYRNTFIGYGSGLYNETGNHNVFLGFHAGFSETGSHRLYIETADIFNSDISNPLIYGEFDNDLVRVNGTFETVWSGSNTEGDGLTNLLLLSADNSEEDLASDAGFALLNAREGKQWNFRTANGGDAFSATIQGTGGTEFKVTNTTSHFSGVQLHLGNGAKNVGGVWINASSRALKENIKELSSQDALAAFHKLQPVTYNYKTDKKEQVVGFIAEDVPELVAINSRDGLSAMDMVAVLTKVVQEQEKVMQAKDAEMEARDAEMEAMKAEVAELKTMKQKVAQLESILTNLALDISNTKKEKVSLNLK